MKRIPRLLLLHLKLVTVKRKLTKALKLRKTINFSETVLLGRQEAEL